MKTRIDLVSLTNELSEPLKEGVPLSLEAMKVLVKGEQSKRKKLHEPTLNCEVLDANTGQVDDYIDDLINKVPKLTVPTTSQIIIKDYAHYTAIVLFLDKANSSFLVLDSAGDPRSFDHYLKLKNATRSDSDIPLFNRCTMAVPEPLSSTNSGAQQTNTYSCGAFALDYACQASRLPDLLATVNEHTEKGMIAWHHLPPSLTWNAESMAWIEDYIKLHPQAVSKNIAGIDMTFKQYVTEANHHSPPGENRAFEYSFKHYQSQVSMRNIKNVANNKGASPGFFEAEKSSNRTHDQNRVSVSDQRRNTK